MRSTFSVLLAAGMIAGCAVPANGPVGVAASLPSATTASKPVGAVVSASSATTATPKLAASANAAPVAKVASAASAASPTGAAPAQPALPKTLSELKDAFKTLRDGARTKDGTAFDLFSQADVPANAVITHDETLKPDQATTGYSVQSTPENTQAKADEAAMQWADDAKQIYVGWGYHGRWAPLSIFGDSRHVYYSVSKSRLLYIDYDFFHFQSAKWESDDMILRYAGQYITYLLNEPRGRYPYTGWMAFNVACSNGYDYNFRTSAVIKAILIEPLIIGPKWVFFDGTNRPIVMVDADSGEVTWEGTLLDILRTVFQFNL